MATVDTVQAAKNPSPAEVRSKSVEQIHQDGIKCSGQH